MQCPPLQENLPQSASVVHAAGTHAPFAQSLGSAQSLRLLQDWRHLDDAHRNPWHSVSALHRGPPHCESTQLWAPFFEQSMS
jgi:hypothetical protein